MRVLVTSGAEKQCLAAVRSLGRAGVAVEVLDPKPDAPAFRSRYCRAGHVSPPATDRAASVAFWIERLRAARYTTVLPCDDLSAALASEERDRFAPLTTLLLPPPESFRTATDKATLVSFAGKAGVPVPRTLQPDSVREAARLGTLLGFPLIVKGHHGWGAQHVRLAHRPADLVPLFEEVAALENAPGDALPVLQEYVDGVGYGFTTLYRYGQARALFMHRRAAEYDVTQAASPYSCPIAESIYDATLEALSRRLFDALEWHGLGMAEWRRARGTGRFVLMEVNPRLVGSTDLAVQSGVDLPLLAALLARDGDVAPVLGYRTGVRLRWLLPDGLRDLLARPRRLLDPITWRSASDWSWRDPAPHWMQLRRAAWALRHGQ